MNVQEPVSTTFMADKDAPIHSNHEIDDEAKRRLAFHLRLPNWILRPETPDYWIDYSVEVGIKKWPSGRRFLIQLKGKRKVKFNRKGLTKFRLERRHADYYAQKCEQPVFLILTDTMAKECYYCFLQGWFDQKLPPENWGKKQSIGVEVKKQSNLSDIETFSSEVDEAFKYMKEKFPSSIKSAIEGRRNELRKVDPYWDYEISTFKNGQESICMFPTSQKSKTFKINLTGADKVNGFINALKTGRPYTLTLGKDTNITGSPIFEHLLHSGKQGALEIGSSNPKDAEMRLSTLDGDKHFHFLIKGKVYPGSEGFTFEGSFHGIVMLRSFHSKEAIKNAGSSNINISICWDNWWEKPVVLLPYFEDIRSFINIIYRRLNFNLKMLIDGNQITSGRLNISELSGDVDDYFRLNEFLKFLDTVRQVSKKMGLEPILRESEDFTEQDVENWEVALKLLKTGKHKQDGSAATFTGVGKINPKFIQKSNGAINKQRFRITETSYGFESLGVKVDLRPVNYTLIPASIEFKASGEEHSFTAEGDKESTLTVEYSDRESSGS